MKKKAKKKLSIKRETVRNLTSTELSTVAGGGTISQGPTCRNISSAQTM
jgi:hypothetical protein